MRFRLVYLASAMREWEDLDPEIRKAFKGKLAERLEHTRVEQDRLSFMMDCYKIKLHSAGYRLVYQVRDTDFVVMIVAVVKRERKPVYRVASKRV